ncbi:glycosyltransferase [bacterium]|nr:glycosyltransferase [bacterium]
MQEYHIFHSINRWMPATTGWIFDQMHLFDLNKQTVLASQRVGVAPGLPRAVFKPQSLLNFRKNSFRRRSINKISARQKILYSHFGNRAFFDINLACDRRIARFYGYDLHRLPHENQEWITRYQLLFEQADVLLTEGPFMKNELVKMGADHNKIVVLPLGIQLTDRWKTRELDGPMNVLIAGAFKEKKGIDTALKACFRYAEQSGNVLHIHLVGDVVNATQEDLAYAAKIENLIRETPKNVRINQHGFVDRETLKKVALQSTVAVLPSQWAADRDSEGGFPVTILELMATGLPIVSTTHCDIPFAVNESNGILCNERDIDALANAINEMTLENNLHTKSIGARKTVEERFNWQNLRPLYHQAIIG